MEMDESVTPLPLTLSQRITITGRDGGVEDSCSGLWSCMVHSGVFPYPDCYRTSHPPSNTPLLQDCQLSTDTGGSLHDSYRRCVFYNHSSLLGTKPSICPPITSLRIHQTNFLSHFPHLWIPMKGISLLSFPTADQLNGVSN